MRWWVHTVAGLYDPNNVDLKTAIVEQLLRAGRSVAGAVVQPGCP
ncbi:hypothetical protein BVI1335_270001 [Burkholderia vietnamiensis]|nr:hypothetical protein BVI1335_270001 [Burkholderia vietnamiensis]